MGNAASSSQSATLQITALVRMALERLLESWPAAGVGIVPRLHLQSGFS